MINEQCINKSCEHQEPGRISIPVILSEITALLSTWRQRARSRRYLASMSRHQLDDIGISESQRQIEIAKPFWC